MFTLLSSLVPMVLDSVPRTWHPPTVLSKPPLTTMATSTLITVNSPSKSPMTPHKTLASALSCSQVKPQFQACGYQQSKNQQLTNSRHCDALTKGRINTIQTKQTIAQNQSLSLQI